MKYTANILIDSFRTGDFISRYAGDKFIIQTDKRMYEDKQRNRSKVEEKEIFL